MKKNRNNIIKLVVVALLYLFVGSKFRNLMGDSDFSEFMRWWGALAVLGIGFLPLTACMFKNFKDKGFIFSKALGLAISGWLVWFLSSFKIIKFTVANCFIFTAVCFTVNYGLAAFLIIRNRKKNAGNVQLAADRPFGDFKLENLVSIAFTELMFFTAFVFWTYLRCFKPEIMGNTEKFMDYGLMTSIDRATYMPAEDIWLSGNTINYYYLGQYLSVFVKRLSGVQIENAYNLALMMLAGFAFAMPYSLMNQVSSDFVNRRTVLSRNGKYKVEEKPDTWYCAIIGILAGLSVCFAGNMHYPIVNGLVIEGKWSWLRKFLSIERESYWFPDATRYIGYTPDVADKTIHEFPSYSFVLGDLHAHVINIMFVLTVMALLYSILQTRRARMDSFRVNGPGSIKGYDIKNKEDIKEMLFKEVLTPQIFLIGFFIGFFHMTNFWDFPIYFVVSGAVILFSNAVICKFRKETLIMTAAHAAVILLVSTIVSLPFKLTFDQISTGIGLCTTHTMLRQLIVLWGLPITVVITFLVVLIKQIIRSFGKKRKKFKPGENPNMPSISKFCDEHPGFDLHYRFIYKLEVTDLYMITLGLCAIGLVLMPEFIYVKDIYQGAYKRANTMFKLTYQAFIMFGMCMPYVIGRLLAFGNKIRQKVFAGVALVLLITTFGYFFNAADNWFGKERTAETYKGLDCVAFMEKYSAEDYAAVQWINENIEGSPTMLEGVGLSYTYYERISATTGLATIMGWETHEWLWRSGANFAKPEEIGVRQKDVQTIYTSTDEAEVRNLLTKYDVDYIYVGEAERYNALVTGDSKSTDADGKPYVINNADGRYYPKMWINDELLRSMGEIVYQACGEDGSIMNENGNYRTYIVKVKKTN